MSKRVVPTKNNYRSVRLPYYVYAFLGVILFLGTIQGAQVMDFWSTSGRGSAERTEAAPEPRNTAVATPAAPGGVNASRTPANGAAVPAETSGAAPAAEANPDDVKGFMTIKEVLDSFAIPKDEMYKRFGIPADVPVETELKDMEPVAPDFSVTDLRTWLEDRTAQ